jgi:hypothetical protein
MEKIKLIEKEIEDIISKSPGKTDPVHSKSTKKWVLNLKPDADEALQIAALAHDIERGFSTPEEDKAKEDFSRYKELKMEHSKKSADIICGILKKYDFEDLFIKRVKHLVEHHEFGGDEETDIIKDADSISFFEDNLEYYFGEFGNDKTKDKIKFTFNRMSERAKEIVKKFEYKNSGLNNLFKEAISGSGN